MNAMSRVAARFLLVSALCMAPPTLLGALDGPSAEDSSAAESPPALYALWSVETKQTVHDNFGHHIANRFYVVELLLNNQLDQQVIITGVGFNTTRKDEEGKTVSIAAADPQAIRGILLKKNQVGGGAVFKHAVAATGLLLTGASGFFKAAGAAATYNRSINIFNDPFQKGIELVMPNTIIGYLETLNQDIYKTGLVLKQGSTGYLRVFVDKNNIFPPSILKTMTDQQKKELYDPREPLKVKEILHQIELQGQQIAKAESRTFHPTSAPSP